MTVPLWIGVGLEKSLLGQEHLDVATILNQLALIHFTQGRYSEAEPLYVKAFEMLEKKLGEASPWTVTCSQNLAELRRQHSTSSSSHADC